MENQEKQSSFCNEVKEFAEKYEATIKANRERKALIVIAVDNDSENTQAMVALTGRKAEIINGLISLMSNNTELIKEATTMMMIKSFISKVKADENDNH